MINKIFSCMVIACISTTSLAMKLDIAFPAHNGLHLKSENNLIEMTSSIQTEEASSSKVTVSISDELAKNVDDEEKILTLCSSLSGNILEIWLRHTKTKNDTTPLEPYIKKKSNQYETEICGCGDNWTLEVNKNNWVVYAEEEEITRSEINHPAIIIRSASFLDIVSDDERLININYLPRSSSAPIGHK